ncbi:MAG: DUF1641 domain-containing protein [Desulfurococcales archaeon]|nr:DUF1641 domain-containing protein [Desulfurococcales archaeon]
MSVEEKDVLGRLLAELENEEFQQSIDKLINIIKNLEASGILDFLEAITDPALLNKLTELFLINISDKSEFFEGLLDQLTDIAAVIEKTEEPKSLTSLLAELRDPEVLRGMARMIKMLKILGAIELKIS